MYFKFKDISWTSGGANRSKKQKKKNKWINKFWCFWNVQEFKICLIGKLLCKKGIFPEHFRDKKFQNNSRISRTVGHYVADLEDKILS